MEGIVVANEKKKRAARSERFTVKRLVIANVIALAALILTATVTLAALGLLPSIFTFFF